VRETHAPWENMSRDSLPDVFAFSGVGGSVYDMCVRAHSGASKWGRVQSLECIRAYNSKPTKLALSWPYKPCASEQRQNGVGFLFLSKTPSVSPTQVSTQSPTMQSTGTALNHVESRHTQSSRVADSGLRV
jgi:hypothetical protein